MEAAIVEHEQVAALDKSTLDRYRTVTAHVALLGGGKSRAQFTTTMFDQLTAVIPNSTATIIQGLDHTGPDGTAAGQVVDQVRPHLHFSQPLSPDRAAGLRLVYAPLRLARLRETAENS